MTTGAKKAKPNNPRQLQPAAVFLIICNSRMERRGIRWYPSIPSLCWVSPWDSETQVASIGEMNDNNAVAFIGGSTQPTRFEQSRAYPAPVALFPARAAIWFALELLYENRLNLCASEIAKEIAKRHNLLLFFLTRRSWRRRLRSMG